MGAKTRATHVSPGGQTRRDKDQDDGVVNDSLETVDPADSTATEDGKDRCDEEKDGARTRKGQNGEEEKS